MNEDKRQGLSIGYWIGYIWCIIVICLIIVIMYKTDPRAFDSADKKLNSPDYVIDTIITINDEDTVKTYKFKYIGDKN